MDHLQTTIQNGKEYYLVPTFDSKEMEEALDMIYSCKLYDSAKQRQAKGESNYPAELVFEILEGKNPVLAYREHKNLTQQQLADKSGVNRVLISEIESGKKDGSIKTVKALANSLNVDVDDLI